MARLLPNWLTEYQSYNIESEAPDLFHLWTGVSVVSCALKRKVWIDQVQFQWIPNFYIIFIAPPGIATKSTTIRIGQGFVTELNTIKIGPDSLTWQTLPKILEESHEIAPMPSGIGLSMCPVVFFASELQSLLDLDDSKMLTILTDLWDGKDSPWIRSTKTTGTNTVSNPFVNIIACITPAGLSALPKQVLKGGFASRTIWIEAHEKRKLIPYPSKLIQPAKRAQQHFELLHDLTEIAQLRGEYTLTKAAIAYGEKWYAHIWKEYFNCDTEEEQGVYARKQTQLHKLAMIIRASQNDSMEITEDDLIVADHMLSQLKKGTDKTFQIVTTTNGQEKTMQILETLIKHGKMLKPELYRRYFHQLASKEFDDALASLAMAGRLLETSNGNKVFLEAISGP